MKNTIDIKHADEKSHYHININGVDMGKWETSQVRHLIETLDNFIE